MSGRTIDARERLVRDLLTLADRGGRPRCAEPAAGELWTADNDADRAHAAQLCGGCPVLDACLESAIAERDRWAVRGGRDMRAEQVKKRRT